jgi:HPt (histidine-containing phosphotransfer) domain-containing protein
LKVDFSFFILILRRGCHYENRREASQTNIAKYEIENLHKEDNRLYDRAHMESETNREKDISQAQHQQAWVLLTQRYLADLPQQLQAIRHCLDRGDLESLQQLVHRAKGTSGTYRLEKIAEQLAHLENLAQGESVQDIPSLLDQLAALVAEATERCVK